MTAPTLSLTQKSTSHRDIAQFLCAVARVKPQDDNASNVYGMALRLDPNCAEAWNGLGRVEMGRGRIDAAIEAFETAICTNRKFAEAHMHCGVAYDRSGMADIALFHLREALQYDPSMTMAEFLIYGIYENQERYGEAREILDTALLKRPDDPDLLFCRATMELAAGDFANGWRDYESRPTKVQLRTMLDEYREWDGIESLEGKRVLVCREQGMGDEIMFVRMVPELVKRGAHVILYCYPALARLFATIPGVAEVVTTDAGVPPFDMWVAMGSLPLKLSAHTTRCKGTCGDAECEALSHGFPLLPAPYLSVADPEPKDATFRVGLCWKGNPAHARDSFRSIPFDQLNPLLDVDGVEFVSLQKDDTESALEKVADRCHDFYDLARALGGIDLVITVDTSVAHLSGALGVPTWVLLGKPSDWRWNTEIYGSVELIRNEAPKKWGALAHQIAGRLAHNPKRQLGFLCTDASENLYAIFETIRTNRGFTELLVPTVGRVRETIEKQRQISPNSVQISPNQSGFSAAETRYGQMQYFTRDVWLGRSIALYGEWSEGECDLYRKVIGKDDVVVEVGANIGAHTVVLALFAKTVIAFEPCEETYALLMRNTHTANGLGADIRPINIAIGASDGGATLKIKPNNPGGTEVVAEEFGQTVVHRLDNYHIEVLNFLKLDCEGSELAVLQGAEGTIARCRPLLYVENDRADKSEALVQWIDARGYRMYQHHTPLFNPDNYQGEKINVFGNIVSAMLFCVPAERYDLIPGEWGMGLERVRLSRRP